MNKEQNYEVHLVGGGVPVKMWTRGVPVEPEAQRQLENIARMPFIFDHIAVMPDVHLGIGATVGSVIPTKGAVIPAAVGVDIGCGMMAVQTTLKQEDLPDSLKPMRLEIEKFVPVGMNDFKSGGNAPNYQKRIFESGANSLDARYQEIIKKHSKIATKKDPLAQVGSLGGGNHFIEVCLNLEGNVWIMLHSGSRGAGNRIGTYFIEMARKEMEKHFINLPDRDLAYFGEQTPLFADYIEAVEWAQEYATLNRKAMLEQILNAMRRTKGMREFEIVNDVVSCHHNYVSREHYKGSDVIVTRKGAVRAREGDMGIIPGSMGTRSYIVRGLGNEDSFNSCSHGAGRVMSRNKAKEKFTLDDHVKATAGVECRKDEGVIDETPAAYKSIETVMAAQSDLVEVVTELKQVLCVKG